MDKLPSLTPEEEVKEPSAEAQELERLRQEKLALEAQLRDRSSHEQAVNTRISELERSLNERYRQVRNAAPPPEPAYQAQQDLGLTDEEILANPKASMEKMAQYIADQRIAQYQSQMSSILGQEVQYRFQTEMKQLSQHPYYADLEHLLRDHFDANPQEALRAGRAQEKFNELVGANLAELQRRAAEREAAKKVDEEHQLLAEQPASIARNRVVEPAIRAGTAPPKATTETKSDFVLDEDPARADAKRRLIDSFNQYGANLSEKEWNEIEDGKVLPKRMLGGGVDGRR